MKPTMPHSATDADCQPLCGLRVLPTELDAEVFLREDRLPPPAAPRPDIPALPLSHAQRDSLYQELQPLVQRLIHQYGDSRDAREDLRGEIFCRFCALLDAFDPSRGVPLRAYLVRQLTASTYTYARSQWRRRSREISLEPEPTLGARTLSYDPTPHWDEGIVMKQIQAILPEALGQLSARQRRVVVLRYFDGYSYEEIAQILEVQPATARSLVRHALTNLRRQLVLRGMTLDG